MLNFQKITLQDQQLLRPVLATCGHKGCQYSFPNLYLWGRQQAAWVGESLVIFAQFDEALVYLYPVGGTDRAPAVEALLEDAAQRGIDFCLSAMSLEDCRELEAMFPGRFRFYADRADFEYIYEIEKLCTLAGKKNQRKRNQVNRFEAEHPNYRLEVLTPQNLHRVEEMTQRWYENRMILEQDWDFDMERAAFAQALRDYEALQLEGLMLLEEDRVLAFSIGSALTPEIFDVHFEKAMERCDGVYGMINRAFARYLHEKYPRLKWLNREDDMGLEGLRKSKLSYHPEQLLEKYCACLAEEKYED